MSMFTCHETDGDKWVEFECPDCHGDMDFEPADAPPPGSPFVCPYCDAALTAQYKSD